MKYQNLEKCLKACEYEDAVRMIKEIGDNKEAEAIPLLVKYL